MMMVVFLALTGYGFYQYNQGLKAAGAITPFEQKEKLLKDYYVNPPAIIETLRIPINDCYTDVGSVLDIDVDKNKQALREFLDS